MGSWENSLQNPGSRDLGGARAGTGSPGAPLLPSEVILEDIGLERVAALGRYFRRALTRSLQWISLGGGRGSEEEGDF